MAFLIDANVLSELRKRNRADPNVRAWYEYTESAELFTSVLVVGEIRQGIERKRAKDPVFAAKLEQWLRGILRDFQSNILPVTQEVAELWGSLSLSQTMAEPDGLIAATALCHNLTLVSRNLIDFRRTGVKTLNPWHWKLSNPQ
jgi:Predicted nucleic acid-binding protein, contains PIN domain